MSSKYIHQISSTTTCTVIRAIYATNIFPIPFCSGPRSQLVTFTQPRFVFQLLHLLGPVGHFRPRTACCSGVRLRPYSFFEMISPNVPCTQWCFMHLGGFEQFAFSFTKGQHQSWALAYWTVIKTSRIPKRNACFMKMVHMCNYSFGRQVWLNEGLVRGSRQWETSKSGWEGKTSDAGHPFEHEILLPYTSWSTVQLWNRVSCRWMKLH